MPDLLNDLNAIPPSGRNVIRAKVSRISPHGESIYAVAPAFNQQHEFGPMPFLYGTDAAIGDAVLVAFDEQGSPWAISWAGEIGAGVDMATQAELNAAIAASVNDGDTAGGDLAGTYPNPTVKSSVALGGNPTATTQAVDNNTTRIATTAFVIGQGYLKTSTATSTYAPLASPTFTGTPAAPTAAGGTNTTQIATTAFVHDAYRLRISDTRATEEAPGATGEYGQTFRVEFKQRGNITGTPGAGTFGTLVTYAKWTTTPSDDSGGGVTQVWYDDSNPPRSFVRRGTTAGGWSAWSEMAPLSALSAYAPLASPTFTGTPAAPTAAGGTNTTQVATTAFVQGEIAAKAPLASPTFTGTPAAPTPSAADSSTKIATTAFVQGEIAAKAPLASPVFTGNPTAPTPAANDNDTSLATTAFVAANALSLLTTGTKRKVSFGSSSTTWPGGSNSSNLMTIAHGLGVAPLLVLVWSLDPPSIASYAVRSAAEDGTNLYIKNITSWLQPAGGTGAGVAWLAIA